MKGKPDHGETVTIAVTLQLFRTVKNHKRLAKAVWRAIDHAMVSDIDGAELINEDTVAKWSAETLRDTLRARFPWLGTARSIDYSDECCKLADLYADLAGGAK